MDTQRLCGSTIMIVDATGRHAQRVGDLSALIAEELGLPADEVELIGQAALLHDVGKIGVPDHILLKRGLYTAEEREQMGAHTAIGARIVAGSRTRLLRLAEAVAPPTTIAGTAAAMGARAARRSRWPGGSWRWPTSSTR